MKIIGSVKSVIFHNNENGYSIVKIEDESNKELIVTGKFPLVGEGEMVEVDGLIKIHPKYGEQLVATKVTIKKPTTVEQIEKYLASGLIAGVGPVTANNIVKTFGVDTLNIIETNPAELSKVRGVSLEKARLIALRYNDIRKLQDAVMFLQNYDVSINMAVKIYDKYKNGTEAIISKNPYKMVEDIDGIGFKTADKIAIKMGIEPDSTFRMRAGIIYILNEITMKTGSTLVDSSILNKSVFNLLGISNENKNDAFDQVVANLIIDGYIKEYIQDQEVYYSLSKYYNMERAIAGKLAKLMLTKASYMPDISYYLEIGRASCRERV